MQEFDYVIVGAGSAGCVLANILSEDAENRVLLVEAGKKDRSPLLHMPGAVGRVIIGGSHNWFFETQPQRHLNNRRIFFPQGKGLGGSSAINGMVYSRGNRQDYDHWRQLGNEGWSYADVLPYFIRHENNERIGLPLHGQSGELCVSDIREPNKTTFAFIDAAAEVGIPRNDDFNGTQQHGVGHFQQTVKNGVRWSAARAFLRPALKRSNLTVLTGQLTTRIIVEEGRAVGIEAEQTGISAGVRRYGARREIIVTSGAVNSPKLLLLSGIGPAAELREHGIEPVHDLPGVGKNFHDHLDITIIYESKSLDTLDGQERPLPSLRHGLRYLISRSGMIADTPCQSSAYVHSGPEVDAPDISMHFLPVGILDHGRQVLDGHNLTFHCNNMRPRSRGEIVLASRSPRDAPLIDPNYLSDPHDMKIMLACIHWARKVMGARAMEKIAGPERYPGNAIQSVAELEDYVRNYSETDYHPVGSCKMGHDPMAVVDHNLKVHGLEGLRVADSSIMPAVISGNTNAPTIMIAAKAADLILGREPPGMPEPGDAHPPPLH